MHDSGRMPFAHLSPKVLNIIVTNIYVNCTEIELNWAVYNGYGKSRMATLEARYYMHFTHFIKLVGCL